MAGDQQARFGEAGHAAAATVAGENGATEKVLLDALFGKDAAGFAGEIVRNLEVVGFCFFRTVESGRKKPNTSTASPSQSAWKSAQISRSRFEAPSRPLRPVLVIAGSRLAKLTSFMATADGVRPINSAS